MKNNKVFVIAALLGTTLASCQKEMEVKPQEEESAISQEWTLKVNAAMDPTTKALSLNDKDLKAYWVENEKVGVYFGSSKIGTLSVASTSNEGLNAVLSGTLDITGLKADDEITLLFPDKEGGWSYTGQDGSAPSEAGTMAKGYDYAVATTTVTDLDNTKNEVIAESATFESQQNIHRLRFKDGTYFQVKSITLTASSSKIVVSRSFNANAWVSTCGALTMDPTVTPDDNFYYMAIRNDLASKDNTSATDVYTFTVIRSSDNAVLEGTKDIPVDALKGGAYIPTSVSVIQKVIAQAAPETAISSAEDVL